LKISSGAVIVGSPLRRGGPEVSPQGPGWNRPGAARRATSESSHPRASWGGLHVRITFVVLMESRRDQLGQSRNGQRRIGTPGFELEPGATLGADRRQIENAFSIEFIAIVSDSNLGLELQRQLHELVRRPHVQAQAVENLDLSADDGRVVAHRQLGRPGHERPRVQGVDGSRAVRLCKCPFTSGRDGQRNAEVHDSESGTQGNHSRRRLGQSNIPLTRPSCPVLSCRIASRRRSMRALIGFLEQLDHIFPRLRLAKEADETLVLQVS